MQQKIALKANNTGSVELHLSLPLTIWTQFIRGNDTPYHANYRWFFDVETGSAAFRKIPGFALRQYRVFELNDRIHVQVHGDLRDARTALAHPSLGSFNLERQNQQLILTRELPHAGELHAGDSTMDWKELTTDLRLNLSISAPGTIVESTATSIANNTAGWSFSGDNLRNPTQISVVFQ